MDFIKYNSIENHYNLKFLNRIPDEYKNSIWITLEKLDGANLVIGIFPNVPIKIGRRTAWLNEGEKFYDVWNTISKYQDILNYFQSIVNLSNEPILFYGELYGRGVQKRIDYGPDQYFKCFDVVVNNKQLSYFEYFHFFEYHSEFVNLNNFFMTTNNEYYSLQEALMVDVDSKNTDKLISEGVIIKPYLKDLRLQDGSRIIIKKKSIAFSDKNESFSENNKPIVNSEVFNLNMLFRNYISKNRMLDLFSKYGEISDIKEIGKYIPLFIEDAKTDFNKEHQIPNTLTNKEIRDIFNVGSAIPTLLKNYLQEKFNDSKNS